MQVNSFFSWRHASAILFLLLLLIFVLYQQTLLYLINVWNQVEIGEYAHGYLVLLISVYLVFINRSRLSRVSPCPSFLAVSAVFISCFFWLLAALVNVAALQSIGLLLLLMSVVWALLGMQISLILLFPILYISFAIPVWFPLSPLLQELTADVVFWLIRLLEVPAFRDNNIIVLPAGRMSVEEACSGLRYLLAALALGALYGYLNYVTLLSRILVVLVSIVAAVLVNIIRVLIVVYLGYSTEMQHPLVYDHLFFGWYLFGGLVIVLLFLDVQLQKKLTHHEVQDITATKEQSICDKGRLQVFTVVAMVSASIIAAPGFLYWVNNQALLNVSSQETKLPSALPGWEAEEVSDDWVPVYHGAISKRATFIDESNHKIYLYLGTYLAQKQGSELINTTNSIADNKIWHSQYQKALHIETDEGPILEQRLVNSDGKRRLVWYWYHVSGQDVVNKYYVKIFELLGYFKGDSQASIVAIAVEAEKDQEDARKLLSQFRLVMPPPSQLYIDDRQD